MANRLRVAAACWLITTLVISAPAALAHAVAVWAEIEGNQVAVEAYFSSGKPVRRAAVEVRSSNGEIVVKGELSKQGRWAFDLPRTPGLYTVGVKAGEAHQGQFELVVPTKD